MVGKRYRILETLGKGAFGTVYRAEVLGAGDFKKQVALKVLDYKGEAPEEIALRFRDEARILGLIRHRAVVGVDSLAELETGWAVVMEYVEGVNVTAAVKYGLPPAKVVSAIVEEVASALHAAWNTVSDETGEALRLVHRDIKPANIRLTSQGEVKVLDFGVARAEFQSREAHTQAMRFGSLRYMAPESFDGIEGHPTDIFALGVVMAELLAGKRLEEPPKNPERYPAFLDGIRDAIVSRLDPALEKAQLDKVIELVVAMVAFEPEDRPVARAVEQRCRRLSSMLPGPSLREWSEDYVPALAEKMARRKAQKGGDDAPSSSILVEKSAGHELENSLSSVPPVVPSTQDATETRADKVVAAASGAMFGAGAMALIVALFGTAFFYWFITEGPGRPIAQQVVEVTGVGESFIGLPDDDEDEGTAEVASGKKGSKAKPAGDSDGDGVVSTEEKRLLIIARRGDVDGDGEVSEDEQREFVITVSGDTDGSGDVSEEEQRLLLIATRGDANQDGTVSEEEQTAFVLASEGDTDGDGTVSEDEQRLLVIAKRGEAEPQPQPTIRVTQPREPAPVPVAPAPPSVPPIAVSGDATAVSFVSSAGSFSASNAPVGTYRIMATFPGQDAPVQAGTVTVVDGQTKQVNCTAMMLRCSAK